MTGYPTCQRCRSADGVVTVTAYIKHHRQLRYNNDHIIIGAGLCQSCYTGHVMAFTSDMSLLGLWDAKGNFANTLLEVTVALGITDNQNRQPTMKLLNKITDEPVHVVPSYVFIMPRKLRQWVNADPTIQDDHG